MKGYPKYMATKQDYLNLLDDPIFATRVLADLVLIRDLEDDKASRTISIDEDGTAVTGEIENPMPLWKIKGFVSREEVSALIDAYGE